MSEDLFAAQGGTRGWAVVSDCQRYRYSLTRTWNPKGERIAFVMLNPSTADAMKDDPTIRRCIGFARAWNYGSLAIYNLFAFRATDPDAMSAAAIRGTDVVGPENDKNLESARACHRVVCAWGSYPLAGPRALVVCQAILTGPLECLAINADGHPRHPLYVPARTHPICWTPRIK